MPPAPPHCLENPNLHLRLSRLSSTGREDRIYAFSQAPLVFNLTIELPDPRKRASQLNSDRKSMLFIFYKKCRTILVIVSVQFSDGENLSVYIRLAKTKLAKNTMKNFFRRRQKIIRIRRSACTRMPSPWTK